MAPAATNGRKKREDQYFEVGKQGRKTGLTLPENPRDEHGIEDLNGIFSSPEKSPAKRVLRNGNATLTSDEMDLAQSSVPEPTDLLSTRRLIRSAKTVLPPAMGRSPYKTNIGSSPRRQSSVAPMSQARRTSATPDRASSQPTISRRLDFTAEEETSVARSPLRAGARRKPGRRDLYELPDTEEETAGDEVDVVDHAWEDPSPQLLEEEILDSGLAPLDEDMEPIQTSSPSAVRKPRRTARHSGGAASKAPQDEDVSLDVEEVTNVKLPAKRGRKNKGQLLLTKPSRHVDESLVSEEPVDESVIESVVESMTEPAVEPAPTKKRGKPKKVIDESELPEEASTLDASRISVPRKRGRPAGSKATKTAQADGGAPPAKRKRGLKPKGSLFERNPNAKMGPPSFKQPGRVLAKSPSRRPSPSMWAGGRAVSRLREGTPAVEAGVATTRSGRTVLKPLQHWAGEKAEYGRDGTIQTVQFSESVHLPKIHRSGPGKAVKRRAGARADKLDAIDEEDDSDDDPEEWEIRCERIKAFVKKWDPVLGQGVDEEEEEHDIAFGTNSFMFKSISNAEFSFAKLQSLPFFGTGVVELPPGGFKRSKNSRRMNMGFFVHQGKVDVTVADTEFTISKGGIWHVPRGNFYNIHNHGTKPARLFYAQGCEVEQEEIEVEE